MNGVRVCQALRSESGYPASRTCRPLATKQLWKSTSWLPVGPRPTPGACLPVLGQTPAIREPHAKQAEKWFSLRPATPGLFESLHAKVLDYRRQLLNGQLEYGKHGGVSYSHIVPRLMGVAC